MTSGLAASGEGAQAQPSPSDGFSLEVAAQAAAVLERAAAGPVSWEEMHAAEAMAACGEGERARSLAGRRWEAVAAPPFRVSAWRMLAATSRSEPERAAWIARIKAVLRTPAASDRVQAIEVLDKLRCRLDGGDLEMVRALAAQSPSPGPRYFCLWALALAEVPGTLERIAAGLASSEALERGRAAATLRGLGAVDPATLAALARAATNEPVGSAAYATVLSAALALHVDAAAGARWQETMEELLVHGSPRERFLDVRPALLACNRLAAPSGVVAMLLAPEADSRIAAAWIILREPRTNRRP